MCNVYQFLLALLFVGTNSLGAHSSIEELNKLTSFSHQVPQQPNSHHTLGRHILAEFQGCINLNNAREVEEVLQKAANFAGATVLKIYVKQFDEVLQKSTTDISASKQKLASEKCINLNNTRGVEEVLQKTADAPETTVSSISVKQFDEAFQKSAAELSESKQKRKSGGFTALAALSESHISIHTWPEYDGYAAIDIFTCGEHIDPQKAIEILKKFFQPKLVTTIIISRGISSQKTNTKS